MCLGMDIEFLDMRLGSDSVEELYGSRGSYMGFPAGTYGPYNQYIIFPRGFRGIELRICNLGG